MYKSYLCKFPYFPTSIRDGGTNASNVQTEYSTQSVTMTFLKLFVKVFTSILLPITMQVNRTYQLTNTGATAGTIYSINGRWKEHVDGKFASLMQTMNNNYQLFMDEAVFCSLFVDPTTKTVLKADALSLVNNLYCEKMLEVSIHTEPSTETTAMLALSRKIPLLY